MNALQIQIDRNAAPYSLRLKQLLPQRLTDDDFYEFCQRNPEWQIEMNRHGNIQIMPNTGGKTGDRNSEINYQLRSWLKQEGGSGRVFDSSTMFTLPNSARRSPDAAWVRSERWNALSEDQKEKFPPICPDFVIELRSKTDSLKVLQAKMREYVENGARLGWLIDPSRRKVYVYRAQQAAEVLDNPATVSGEDVVVGFNLDLTEVWN